MNINFKETIRWASKQKTTTFLIIAGMSIGVTVTLLIGLWGMNEFSFDKFHTNADRMYRTCRELQLNNETVKVGSDFRPVGEEAKNRYPEVEDKCNVVPIERDMVKIKDEKYFLNNVGAVDANFFQFFSFKLESGSAETCLDAPDKAVISREVADKYYPNENPVGQIIELQNGEFSISGIMENMPENSQLQFNVIVPIEGVQWLKNSTWGGNDCFVCYLLLRDGADSKTLSENITAMAHENFPTYDKFEVKEFLQPFLDVHFSSGFRFEFVKTADRRIVFIFVSLAILILLIASFNFVNMFISTSFLRAKSIGVKKINGSSKLNLFLSSYFETGLYIFISTIIAIALTVVLLPTFNQLADTHLTLSFTDYRFYLFVGTLFIVTMLIAGTFPVLYMLRFNPASIIRNSFKGSGITILQRTLIISQFAASILLICSAGIIKKQIEYVKNKDLGFNKEHIVYVRSLELVHKYDAVREELLKNPNILDVTAKNCLPSDWQNGSDVALTDNPSVTRLMENCSVKPNYFEMMQMPIVEGRNPFENVKDNNPYCLMNEQAVKSFGLTNPIGKQVIIFEKTYTIEGVVKNANTKSLHSTVDPQVYTYLDHMWGDNPIMIKTNDNTESVIASLKTEWGKYCPNNPFEYHFLDQTYDKLYKTEGRASKIITIGMVIAFFLAFMGLYAIAHYATERRVKEIGVRKVNGAKISEILLLLNTDFMRWIIISIAIATPVTWYLLNKWLENFAYRTTLSWWIFALAGLLALGIALLTVSWQSWRAATRNPVEALRYE